MFWKILKIIKNLIIHFQSSRRRSKYIKNYKECITLHPHLGKPAEGEEEWLQKWRKYDKNISPLSYRVFSRYIGPDVNILPMELCANIIEPVLTPRYYEAFYNDKNSFGLLYDKNDMPVSYVRNIAGVYYDDDYKPIDAEITSYIKAEEVIVKPTTESSGRGVALFTRKNGKFYDKNSNILTRELLDKVYKADFIIQERFVQSDYMSQFNPSSVNTIRISMYKDPQTGQIRYLRGIVRIGGAGAIVDNAHAGGRFIGIDDNGVFGKYVCDSVGNTSSKHGDIDFSQNVYIVPNFDQIKAFATKMCTRFIHHGLFALDIVLDKNNNPKMLEVNVQGFSAWLFQFTSGTAFREYTDSVMDFCLREIKKESIIIL